LPTKCSFCFSAFLALSSASSLELVAGGIDCTASENNCLEPLWPTKQDLDHGILMLMNENCWLCNSVS
jgi:hypothetical protein